MGMLRLMLALAVAIGHGRGWVGLTSADAVLGLHPIHPYYAVQLFFVISGFYMALVFDGKYNSATADGRRRFWWSRAARLLPAYWLVAGVTLVCAWFFPDGRAYVVQAVHGACQPQATVHDIAMIIYLLVTNVALIAQDLVEFVSLCDRPSSGFLLVSQAWSVGMELWFYLLTPWLVRFRTRWLLALVALSLGIRLLLVLSDLPFYPWQQRFMPAELLFFVLGILGYRARGWWKADARFAHIAGWCALTLLLAVSGGIGWIFGAAEPRPMMSVALGLLMWLCVPPIFALTARWRFDHSIGDLSYPIYLWHIFLGIFVWPIGSDATGITYLGLLLALAALTVRFVEQPVNRWRHTWTTSERPAIIQR